MLYTIKIYAQLRDIGKNVASLKTASLINK